MKKQIDPEGIIKMLTELIATCQNGEQGFAKAAEQLSSTPIKSFCYEQSRVRAQFSTDLQDEMHSLNLTDGANGFHGRRLTAAFTGGDLAETYGEDCIVALCRKADDLAVHQYEHALTHLLPATLRSVIEYQHRRIKQAHDQMKMWDRRDGA